MYFDLKLDGGISNFEAALEELRSEKKPVSTILLGQTHFTEKELEVMGKSTYQVSVWAVFNLSLL